MLEILCISMHNSKDVRGIKADKEEIRLSFFADDLTGFLKDDLSLINFLRLAEDYGSCSCNHKKSEIMILGNRTYTIQHDNAVTGNLKIKKAVKILRVVIIIYPG